jgi:hypothetical protein
MPPPTGPTRLTGGACAPTASGWTPTDLASDYAAGSLIQSYGTPAHAQQAPYDKCVGVHKIQYDSAKKQNLLEHRFGIYVRTYPFLRRRYRYCH